MDLISIPVAPGELIDKITILQIKAERISGEEKRANVKRELALLEAVEALNLPQSVDYKPLAKALLDVNAALWDIEEGKRDCERRQDFGESFIKLARSVYIENDRRAKIKRAINEMFGSQIVEEKSYAAY